MSELAPGIRLALALNQRASTTDTTTRKSRPVGRLRIIVLLPRLIRPPMPSQCAGGASRQPLGLLGGLRCRGAS